MLLLFAGVQWDSSCSGLAFAVHGEAKACISGTPTRRRQPPGSKEALDISFDTEIPEP